MPGPLPLPPPVAAPVVIAYGRGGPNRFGRPRRLTVLGVVGLVLGVLSVAGNGVSGFMMLPLLRHVNPAPPAQLAVPKRLPLPVGLTPSNGEVVDPRGLASADRRRITSYLVHNKGLPSNCAFALDALLAERGESIFGSSRAEATEEALARKISEVKVETKGMDPTTRQPLVTRYQFTTAAGVVRIEQPAAWFTPVGASASYAARVWCANPDHVVFNDEAGHVLTGTVTLERIVHGPTHLPMTPIQAGAVVKELRRTDLAIGALQRDNLWKVGTAGAIAVGTESVSVRVLWVDPEGRSTWNPAPNLDPDTFTPIAPKPPPPPPGLSRLQVYAMLGMTGLMILLAISLLTVSDQVLRNRPKSRRNMLVYACADLVLTIAGAVMGVCWAKDWAGSSGLPMPNQGDVVAAHVLAALVSFIWPAAIFIIMLTHRVIVWYKSLAAADPALARPVPAASIPTALPLA